MNEIMKLEADKMQSLEQNVILERQVNLYRKEIAELQEQLKITESEKSRILKENDEIQSQVGCLKKQLAMLKKDKPAEVEIRDCYQEDLLKKSRQEFEAINNQLRQELIKSREESQLRLNLIKELTAANERLEEDVKETSFLLEERFDFDPGSTPEQAAESPRTSIFGELANEIHSKLSLKFQESALDAAYKESQERAALYFSRLKETDLATLNRNLKQAFDITKIVQMSNGIVENILMEIKESSSQWLEGSCYQEILIYLCNQRLLLNEYIKLYYEKVEQLTKVTRRKRTKSIFSFFYRK